MPVSFGRLGHIPTHEIGRVSDVITTRAHSAFGPLIFAPCSVQGLAIAERGRLTTHRNDAQSILMRRAVVRDEFAFLIDHRHQNMGFDAPIALCRAESTNVLRALCQNCAGVIEVPRSGPFALATTAKHQHNQQCAKDSAHLPLALYFCKSLADFGGQ
jgi:hypothetical protein